MYLLALGAEFLPPLIQPLTAMYVCYTGSVVQVLFSISITKFSFSNTELSAKLLLLVFYLFLIRNSLRNF